MKEAHLVKIFYHDFVDKDRVMMFYNGAITHNITDAFTMQLEHEFKGLPLVKRVKKRVFNLMVECMQNISRHSVFNNDTHDAGYGTFLVLNEDDSYILVSANLVNKEQERHLSKSLESINTKDRLSLKELYKKQLLEGAMSEKGGAGLGFIDIAKKASEKLEYDFVDYNGKYKIFLLKVIVSKL